MEKMGKDTQLTPATKLLRHWFPALAAAIKAEIQDCKAGKKAKGRNSYAHLIDHDSDKLAAITIHEALSVLLNHMSKTDDDGGLMVVTREEMELDGTDAQADHQNMVRVLNAAQAVGKKVQTELNRRRLELLYEGVVSNIEPHRLGNRKLLRPEEVQAQWHLHNFRNGKKDGRTEARINAKAKEVLEGGEEVEVDWSTAKKVQVGAALLQLLIDSATIPNTDQPAFTHKFVYMKGKKGPGVKRYGFIGLDSRLNQEVEELHSSIATLHAKVLPMLSPPLPWTASGRRGSPAGGYLTVPAEMMRTKGRIREQSRALQEADLRELFQALNSASETPWAVNTFVLDNVKAVYTDASEFGDVPGKPIDVPEVAVLRTGLVEDPAWPEKMATHGLALQTAGRDERFEDFDIRLASHMGPTEEQKEVLVSKEVERLQNRVKRDNANVHSMRCDLQLKLNIAEQLRDRNFYFPHNVDFRGRIYPVSPHFNHLGADFCRAMLRFAEAKPVGERGMYWMKIHLANLAGKDKLTFDGRQQYIDTMTEEIMDSADRPLDGKRWWLEADEPWQCLAMCQDLTAALRSPDPLAYASAMPIHQDGSCNGLQHYAALGRDEFGASQVDLVPADKPQDVYMGVCTLVQEKVRQDAANPQSDSHMLATMLDGKVDRKIVKQTVMTSVYGVTYIGAREQIANRLKDINFPEDYVYKASAYLARQTLGSIGEVFTGADSIMQWLGKCAQQIAHKGYDVAWVTPLGLPVVQPYREPRRMAVNTALQQIVLHELNDQPVKKTRQKSAFPPNFVHSLDSTHLLMTARSMSAEGLAFAAVHDSYWTHACDVDRMNIMLREEFVDLHSQPILENLHRMLQLRYPEVAKGIVSPEELERQENGSWQDKQFASNGTGFSDPPPKGNLDLQKVKQSPYFFD